MQFLCCAVPISFNLWHHSSIQKKEDENTRTPLEYTYQALKLKERALLLQLQAIRVNGNKMLHLDEYKASKESLVLF